MTAVLRRFDNQDCITTYAASVKSANSEVVVVTSKAIPPTWCSGFRKTQNQSWWLGPSHLAHSRMHGCVISPFGVDVLLAQPLTQQTGPSMLLHHVGPQRHRSNTVSVSQSKSIVSYSSSLAIMLIVIVCNLVKAVCMASSKWRGVTERLVALGGAIPSFLSRPDMATKGSCMLGITKLEAKQS